MSNYYKIRDKCIICNSILIDEYFKENLRTPSAHYCVDYNKKCISQRQELENVPFYDLKEVNLPFNIFICKKCDTIQNKYLADLNIVYKYGHNEGTGKLYKEMHENFLNFITSNNDVKDIVEVGASVGTLSEKIIEKYDNTYYIVEPNYPNKRNNRIKVIRKYIEEVNKGEFESCNTLIMSHILEHFYEPKNVLNKLLNNTNIKYFYLLWPDLDHYIKNNILNVLTIEHTFFITLDNLIELLKTYNFVLNKHLYFKNHTVMLYFEKKNNNKKNSNKISNNKKSLEMLNIYFNNIRNTISKINAYVESKFKSKKVYLWPCSIHNLYFLKFKEFKIDKISAFLDNSPNKIDKKVYGTNKICHSFNEIINTKNKNDFCIILNGGPFNFEVEKMCIRNGIEIVII